MMAALVTFTEPAPGPETERVSISLGTRSFAGGGRVWALSYIPVVHSYRTDRNVELANQNR